MPIDVALWVMVASYITCSCECPTFSQRAVELWEIAFWSAIRIVRSICLALHSRCVLGLWRFVLSHFHINSAGICFVRVYLFKCWPFDTANLLEFDSLPCKGSEIRRLADHSLRDVATQTDATSTYPALLHNRDEDDDWDSFLGIKQIYPARPSCPPPDPPVIVSLYDALEFDTTMPDSHLLQADCNSGSAMDFANCSLTDCRLDRYEEPRKDAHSTELVALLENQLNTFQEELFSSMHDQLQSLMLKQTEREKSLSAQLRNLSAKQSNTMAEHAELGEALANLVSKTTVVPVSMRNRHSLDTSSLRCDDGAEDSFTTSDSKPIHCLHCHGELGCPCLNESNHYCKHCLELMYFNNIQSSGVQFDSPAVINFSRREV